MSPPGSATTADAPFAQSPDLVLHRKLVFQSLQSCHHPARIQAPGAHRVVRPPRVGAMLREHVRIILHRDVRQRGAFTSRYPSRRCELVVSLSSANGLERSESCMIGNVKFDSQFLTSLHFSGSAASFPWGAWHSYLTQGHPPLAQQ
eukprot:751050-Hanusia_phi.AAC.1